MAGPIKPIEGGEPKRVGEIPAPLPPVSKAKPGEIKGAKEIERDALSPTSPKSVIVKFKGNPDGYVDYIKDQASEINKFIDALKKVKYEDLVDAKKRDVIAAKKFDDLIYKIMQVPGGPIEMTYAWVAFPMDNIVKEFVDVGGVGENTLKAIFVTELIFRVFERIGKGAGLFYKREALNNLKLRVKTWKENKELTEGEEKRRLKELKDFIQTEEKKLYDESLKYILESLIYVPTGLKTVLVMIGEYSGMTSYAVGWTFFIAGIAAGSYLTHKAYKDIKTYDDFILLVKEEPILTEGMRFDQESRKIRIKKSARIKLQKGIQKIIDKRKAYNKKRARDYEDNFNGLIVDEFKKAQAANDFEALKQNLIEKGGIDLSRFNITTMKEFNKVIRKKSTDYENLLRQYVDFKETARITQARLALKAMAQKKVENVKKFYSYALARAATVLTLSTLIFIVGLIIKTLAMTGVAVGALALSALGIGFVVLGVMLLIVGIYVLYRYKPNLFKAMLRGVQLQLAFVSIPAFIQQFRQTIKDKKVLEEILRVQNLSVKLIELQSKKDKEEIKIKDPETKRLLTKLGVKINNDGKCKTSDAVEKLEGRVKEVFIKWQKLDAELKSLDEKVKHWNKKLKPLQEELKDAKFKDFERAARLVKDRAGKDYNFHEVIADALMAGGGDLDKDTIEVLEKNLGIDWDKIPKEKDQVMDYLKTFFSFDEAETRAFFDKQLQKAKGV